MRETLRAHTMPTPTLNLGRIATASRARSPDKVTLPTARSPEEGRRRGEAWLSHRPTAGVPAVFSLRSAANGALRR